MAKDKLFHSCGKEIVDLRMESAYPGDAHPILVHPHGQHCEVDLAEFHLASRKLFSVWDYNKAHEETPNG